MRRGRRYELGVTTRSMHAQATELCDLVNMYRLPSVPKEHVADPNMEGESAGIVRARLRVFTAERDRLVVLLLRYLSLEDVRRRRMDALPPSHRYRADL